MKRVVIAGMGDTGTLAAIALRGRAEVVGISTKEGFVSGQELGLRLARPDAWVRDYHHDFDAFRGLDHATVIHGAIVGVDLDGRTVDVATAAGEVRVEPFDDLIIATGVTNGFWRGSAVRDDADLDAELAEHHHRLASATSVAVIGSGAAAVSAAANIAAAWPSAAVALYFPGPRALAQHHPRVWRHVAGRLDALGVAVHAGHRAVVPGDADRITSGPVSWSTGQVDTDADAVLWAIGRVRPNTDWLPPAVVDRDGFVPVTEHLRVVGQDHVWAVGDVAATDPLRSSARNRGHRIVAANVTASDRDRALRRYRPRHRRWGSVLGPQPQGLEVFAPSGRRFRFPAWAVDAVLQPWIVRRGIYGGIRRHSSPR